MLINQRIIWKDNSTLKDLSINLNDLFAGTHEVPFNASQDYLFIGSDLPFNHRFFHLKHNNDQASVPVVSIWDGSTWNNAVDILDQTDGAGITLAADGIISWTTDETKAWFTETTTENIPELSSLKIYNMNWVRIGFTGNWKANTELGYIGHKFSDDNMLKAYYPDLGRATVLTAHTAGKGDWFEQHVLAAEAIIAQLRKERVISSGSQIFGWEMFQIAAVHKTAQIIYGAFGEAKAQERDEAKKQYDEAMNQIVFNYQDKNADGHIEYVEQFGSITWRRG